MSKKQKIITLDKGWDEMLQANSDEAWEAMREERKRLGTEPDEEEENLNQLK